jgi:DivIVA domain-containing protein
VRHATFSKAPLSKRGYGHSAVDAFLRLVETTLASYSVSAAGYIAHALEHTHARKPSGVAYEDLAARERP